jgi:looped-hinge helix DNA binding domain, AbrB family
MEMAKISSKGQINIPVAIREFLNLNAGDKVVFIVDGESVRMLNASSLKVTEGGGAPVKRE